jgi:pimeloyl-ACP methyl ester carboxylesterase
VVKELHELLRNAGLQPPFVLVGHSLGGIDVQLYSSRYPNEVAGVVLVDSSHENQMVGEEEYKPSLLATSLDKLSLFLGVTRFNLRSVDPPPSLSPVVAAAYKEHLTFRSHTRYWLTVEAEAAAMPASLAQVHSAPMQLGDKPLIVLTRGKGLGREDDSLREKKWMGFQADLASRSTNSKHIIAEKSGHLIQVDQPELVIDAIRQVVDAVRQNRRI